MVNFTNRNAIFQIYVAQKYLEVPQCHQNMIFDSKLIHYCIKSSSGGNYWILIYRGFCKFQFEWFWVFFPVIVIPYSLSHLIIQKWLLYFWKDSWCERSFSSVGKAQNSNSQGTKYKSQRLQEIFFKTFYIPSPTKVHTVRNSVCTSVQFFHPLPVVRFQN